MLKGQPWAIDLGKENTDKTFSKISNDLFIKHKPNFKVIRTFNINEDNVYNLGDKGGDIDKLLNAIKVGLLNEMTNSQEPTNYEKYFINLEGSYIPNIKAELVKLAQKAKELAQKKTLKINLVKRATTLKTNNKNNDEIFSLYSYIENKNELKNENKSSILNKTIEFEKTIETLWKINQTNEKIVNERFENNLYNLLKTDLLSTTKVSKQLPENLSTREGVEVEFYKDKLNTKNLSNVIFNEEVDYGIKDIVNSVFESINPNFDNIFKFNVNAKDAQTKFDDLLTQIKIKNVIMAKELLADARATGYYKGVVAMLDENNAQLKSRLKLLALKIYRNKKIEIKDEAKAIVEKTKEYRAELKQDLAEIELKNKSIDLDMKKADEKIVKLQNKINSRNIRTSNTALRERVHTDEYIKSIDRTMADEDLSSATNLDV